MSHLATRSLISRWFSPKIWKIHIYQVEIPQSRQFMHQDHFFLHHVKFISIPTMNLNVAAYLLATLWNKIFCGKVTSWDEDINVKSSIIKIPNEKSSNLQRLTDKVKNDCNLPFTTYGRVRIKYSPYSNSMPGSF